MAKECNEAGKNAESPKLEDFWGRAALECNRIYAMKYYVVCRQALIHHRLGREIMVQERDA